MNKFSFGLWNVLSDPQSVRATSTLVDFIIIDLEHGYRDWSQLLACVSEARSQTINVWVRLRSFDDPLIQSLLDLGITHFVVPQVRSLQQIDDLRAKLDYPPRGVRGQHPRTSHGNRANNPNNQQGEIHLCVIFETAQILLIADEVLSHPGVDGIYLGTYDLSAELNLPLGPRSPELIIVLGPVLSKAKALGKSVTAMTGDVNLENAWKSLGVDNFVLGIDSDVLRLGLTSLISDFHQR